MINYYIKSVQPVQYSGKHILKPGLDTSFPSYLAKLKKSANYSFNKDIPQ